MAACGRGREIKFKFRVTESSAGGDVTESSPSPIIRANRWAQGKQPIFQPGITLASALRRLVGENAHLPHQFVVQIEAAVLAQTFQFDAERGNHALLFGP